MRKLSALVLVGAVMVPLSLAQAATEVLRLPANNTFANAVSNDPVTEVSKGVFVSREKGRRGGPIDRIFYIISDPSTGISCFGGGILPDGAFTVSAHAASLRVDINAITLDIQECPVPANGVISVDWAPFDSFRTSGSTQFDFDNVHAIFAGTGVTKPSDIAGNMFGVPLADPFGDVTILNQGLMIITKD